MKILFHFISQSVPLKQVNSVRFISITFDAFEAFCGSNLRYERIFVAFCSDEFIHVIVMRGAA